MGYDFRLDFSEKRRQIGARYAAGDSLVDIAADFPLLYGDDFHAITPTRVHGWLSRHPDVKSVYAAHAKNRPAGSSLDCPTCGASFDDSNAMPYCSIKCRSVARRFLEFSPVKAYRNIEARRLLKIGLSRVEIAERLGVTPACIYGYLPIRQAARTAAKRDRIRELRDQGVQNKEIADFLGLSLPRVYQLVPVAKLPKIWRR